LWTELKQLVDLMHGDISLESKLGNGTTAMFWIPFKKVEYMPSGSALVDIGPIPDRLQSELSMSCTSSEDRITPPITPSGLAYPSAFRDRGGSGVAVARLSVTLHPPQDHRPSLSEVERKKIHVLVIEDKFV